jgi:putative Mn2+ efflux pump MntP
MNLFDIITIAFGLAMDCLAVSIACGIIFKRVTFWPFFRIAFLFGLFQGIMPLIGWYAGSTFNKYISSFDHWIAFVILLFLGGKMMVEFIKGKDETGGQKKLNPWKLSVVLTLALATSIDALAVGISFAFLDFEPYVSALIIGLVTLLISFLGLFLGSKYGRKLHIPAELLGGIVLIGIGTKILIEHLFF